MARTLPVLQNCRVWGCTSERKTAFVAFVAVHTLFTAARKQAMPEGHQADTPMACSSNCDARPATFPTQVSRRACRPESCALVRIRGTTHVTVTVPATWSITPSSSFKDSACMHGHVRLCERNDKDLGA
jgi:hypothetical protein